MFFNKNKIIFSTILIVFFSAIFFGFSQQVFSATDSIDINMTVPSASSPPPATDSYPTISNVVATTTQTTADITWTASDDKGISSVSFHYGTSLSYGNTGVVSSTYAVSLSGLTADTLYYYKISVEDTIGQITLYEDSFSTLAIPPPDTTPPIISNLVVVSGVDNATISWDTNETADSQVLYGLDSSYGSSLVDSNFILNHSIDLVGLVPSTTYHYQVISTDNTGNSTNTTDAIFTTSPDSVPPPDVSNLQIVVGTDNMSLSWSNPPLATTPDFSGVKVLRKVGSSSVDINDGDLLYTGGAQTFIDTNVSPNVDYYYTVFSFDTSNNYSGGVFVNGIIIPPVEICDNGLDDDGDTFIDCDDSDCSADVSCRPPAEVCDNGLDDDGDTFIDCDDSDCSGYSSCQPPPVEICNNGTDDDGDTFIDCDDSDCSTYSSCQPPPTEVCDNGLDDDGDTFIDCDDSDCSGLPVCQTIPGQNIELCSNGIDDDGDSLIDCDDSDCSGFPECSVIGGKLDCEDGVDNDNDGLIDFPDDPGCSALDDVSEVDVPIPTVPTFSKISFSDLIFLGGNRNIKLEPKETTVTGLAGAGLSIGILNSAFSGPFESLFLNLGDGAQHQFVYDASTQTYYSDVIFPSLGNHEGFLQVDYGAGQIDIVNFKIESLPWGLVQSDVSDYVSDTQVILYNDSLQFEMNIYGQPNPFLTNANGSYGWVIPNGKYYIIAKKDGYYERKTPSFNVDNNVINRSLFLLFKPKKLVEVIDPNASIGENVQNVVENLFKKSKVGLQASKQEIFDTAEIVQEVADNPVVEKTASRVVAPTAVTVASVGTIAVVSWANLLALLRFLFLQPVILLGRRKRERWGEVYNTLNKMPVDLATVRLWNLSTNRIIQSRVTDMAGRYMFMIKPGKYKITVNKAGFVFPSVLLKDFKSDGSRVDIYHGEALHVSEKETTITANIPLDPVGATKTPRRIRVEKFVRTLQNVVAWAGLVITLISLYISPKWYVWLLLAIHLTTFYFFRRLAHPPKPKGWGIVYDKFNKKPISRAIARLFDAQFNKLVATEITDKEGHYAFLVGENKYYITYEHNDYKENKTEVINLKGKKKGTLALDVALEKEKKK